MRKALPSCRVLPLLAALLSCSTVPVAQVLPSRGIEAKHFEIRATQAAGNPVPLHVEMRLSHPPRGRMVVGIPLWTPGSYRLRPFPEQIKDLRAFAPDGTELPLQTLHRGRFEVATGDHPSVVLRYRVDLDGNGRFMMRGDQRRALTYEGPEVYLYVVGREHTPTTVRFLMPEGWRHASGLTPLPDGSFFAPDYDVLVDCPVKLGEFQDFSFDAAGARIDVVVDGPGDVEFDAGPWLANIKKVVETQATMFGGLPLSRYLFLYTASPGGGGGGLEHLNSTTIGVPVRTLRSDPRAALSTTAHEFFHLWNVKRLRPRELGPFDYTGPVRTRHLWLMEGVTSYYTDVTLARAGLQTEAMFWRKMAAQIATFESAPARPHVSSEEASLRVWDPMPPDRQLNYYNSGLVLGLCLDLEIRARTNNQRCLDDVMRALWIQCEQRGHGFDDADVAAMASAVAGVDLRPFFERHVAGTLRPEYERLLAAAGIRCQWQESKRLGLRGVRSQTRDGKRLHLFTNPDRAATTGAGSEGVILSLDDQPVAEVADLVTLIRQGADTVVLEIQGASGVVARVRAEVEERIRVTVNLTLDESADPAQLSVRRGITGG